MCSLFEKSFSGDFLTCEWIWKDLLLHVCITFNHSSLFLFVSKLLHTYVMNIFWQLAVYFKNMFTVYYTVMKHFGCFLSHVYVSIHKGFLNVKKYTNSFTSIIVYKAKFIINDVLQTYPHILCMRKSDKYRLFHHTLLGSFPKIRNSI